MIRYLQRLRAKRGFTVVELIVVVAIIAILLAVILSNMGTDGKKKQAASTYATDFYSSVQYCFTKYMKYEAELSSAVADYNKTNPALVQISYDVKLNGNYPKNKYTFIKMFISNNQMRYVQVKSSFEDMVNETSTACITPFDEQLMNDIGTVMEANVDGYYYALVMYADAGKASTDARIATVKVHSAYYTARPLSPISGDKDDYRTDNLRFKDYFDLSNGNICGVCSSMETTDPLGAKTPLGAEDSFFMNIRLDPTDSALKPVD